MGCPGGSPDRSRAGGTRKSRPSARGAAAGGVFSPGSGCVEQLDFGAPRGSFDVSRLCRRRSRGPCRVSGDSDRGSRRCPRGDRAAFLQNKVFMEKEGRSSQQRNIRQLRSRAAPKTRGLGWFDASAVCVPEAAAHSGRSALCCRGGLLGGQPGAQDDPGVGRGVPSRRPARQSASLDRGGSGSGFLHGIVRGGGWTDGGGRVLPQARLSGDPAIARGLAGRL